MAELRAVCASAVDRLAATFAVQNGLSPQEGREEAVHALAFFSALLGLPSPDLLSPRHGTTSQSALAQGPDAKAA